MKKSIWILFAKNIIFLNGRMRIRDKILTKFRRFLTSAKEKIGISDAIRSMVQKASPPDKNIDGLSSFSCKKLQLPQKKKGCCH
jgi:hypothetical protein